MSLTGNEDGQLQVEEDYNLDFGTPEEESQKDENLTVLEDSQSEQVQEEGTAEVVETPTEGEKKDTATETPVLTDVEALQQQLNEALGQLAFYKTKELEQPKAEPQKTEQVQQTATQPKDEAPAKLDFLHGRDHLEILQSAEAFNTLLGEVASVAFNAAVNASQEQIMRRIPSLVQSSAQQQLAIDNVTRDFYAQNPDLVNFRQAVSMAAMQLYNENPNLKLPELLSGAAQRTRELLRLSKVNTRGVRKPAQPAGGSVRSAGGNRVAELGEQELDDQQKQIMELLNL